MEYAGGNYHAAPTGGRPWKPSFFRRLPRMGLACIFGAMLGVAASIVILRASDGALITSWRYSPTVYLSISYTITNILLCVALSEGVTISWWRKALGERTRLGDLHRYWSFGTKFLAAARSTTNREFNLIAFACILVAITPINGPLLQRSSSVIRATVEMPMELQVQAATSLVGHFTGIFSGRGRALSLITPEFTPVLQAFYESSDVMVSDTGCASDGICSGYIQAAGIVVNCSEYSVPFDATPGNDSQNFNFNGSDVFTTSFYWAAIDPTQQITMNVTYKDQAPCNGSLSARICTFRVGTVQYPIIINGNRSTVALKPGSSINDDVVNSIDDYSQSLNPGSSGPTSIGGFYLALKSRFESTAHLRWVGARGYELVSVGTTAPQYGDISMVQKDYEESMCYVKFTDPTDFIIEKSRELMFRTALAFGNSSTVQPVVGAMQTTMVNVYVSHYGFLGAAVGLTVISIFVVLITFRGFWILGRPVSMSPIELAKAFNAPLLAGEDSNAGARELVRSAGMMPVRYGFVDGDGEGSENKFNVRVGVEEIDRQGRYLEIAHPGRVSM